MRICLIIFISFLSASRLEATGSTISVKTGNDVVLPCDVKRANLGRFPFVIEWSRPENPLPIFYKIGRYPSRVNSNFKGRTSLLRNSASLRLRNVKLSDEGWYECRVLFFNNDAPSGDDEERNSTWIKLVVTARPVITIAPPPTFEGKENESLMLRCKIEGKPTPEIGWWKNDWPLTNGKNGYTIVRGKLVVSSLRKSHRGRYECRGWNADGQVQHTTQVYVKAPPELLETPQNLTLKENLDAYFSCKATGYPRTIEYSWFYKGKSVASVTSLIRRYNVTSDGTFIIFKVNRHDTGQVTCQASNGYGDPVTASAHLTIQYRARALEMPTTAYGGLTLTVTLPCNSEGEPPINTVTWRKNGKILTPDTSEHISTTSEGGLRIKNMLPSDRGRYTCAPYNILGSTGESSPVNLIAKEPPKFILRPPSVQEPEMGKSLHLFCVGEGDPKPSMSWRKIDHSNNLPNRRVYWNEGNLTITSIKKEDHGAWQCLLTSPVAQMISSVQINVKYTTPHDVENVSVVTTSNSAYVSWSPGYDGGYPQHFMIWFKRVDQGDHAWRTKSVNRSRTSAVVSNLEPETVYQFSVLAESVLGSGRFSDTVTARTKSLPTEPPMRDRNSVPPPQELTYSVNTRGAVVLSWKKTSLQFESLLGYLIEFRIASKSNHVTQYDMIQSNRQARKKRRTSDRSANQQRSIENEKQNDDILSASRISEIVGNSWEVLAAYPENVSKVEINNEKLLQDEVYEFHVLAVTPRAYSLPSKSVYVNTTGLVFYLPSSVAMSVATLSGIVAGVAFFCFMVLIFLGYCFYRCRAKNMNDSHTTRKNELFSKNSKSEVDETKKTLIARISSSTSSSTSDVMSKTESNTSTTKSSKVGILQKMKNHLHKNNSSTTVKEIIKQPSFVPQKEKTIRNEELSHVAREDKFDLSSPDDVAQKIIQRNELQQRDSRSRPGHVSVLCDEESSHKSRPCDVKSGDDLTKRKTDSLYDLSDLEGNFSLEIDCSQSNIKVRFVNFPRNSPMPKPPFLFSPNPKFLFPKKTNPSLCTNNSNSSADNKISVHQKSFSNFMPESDFFYLTGFRKRSPAISSAANNDSAFPNRVTSSSYTSTPSIPPGYYYHHTGRDFQITPNGGLVSSPGVRSYSVQENYTTRDFSNPFDIFLQRDGAKSLSPDKSNFSKIDSDLPNSSINEQTNPCQSNTSINQTTPNQSNACSNQTKLKSSTVSLNNNENVLRNFRSRSWSLPPQTYKKVKNSEKNFSSVNDLLMNSDGESDQKCEFTSGSVESDHRGSFTSGSASTVRCVPSFDSSFSINDRNSDSLRTLQQDARKNKEEKLVPQLKTRDSISPVVPPSDLGASSCSGYESQNTSSDTSSNHAKPQSRLPKVYWKKPSCGEGDSNLQLPEVENPDVFDHSDHNTSIQRKSNRKLRESSASSEDPRPRRDCSSVDDKYEWDSESAMESEILEALKHFGSQPRDKPVPNNILKELKKLSSDQLEAPVFEPKSHCTTKFQLTDEDEIEEDCVLSPDSESLYSKEKIKMRCAALKEEYLEHKRRTSSQTPHPSSPNF